MLAVPDHATRWTRPWREVTGFYRVYHSMRYVRRDLIVRLNRPVSDATLDRINAGFRTSFGRAESNGSEGGPQEANEPDLAELPATAVPIRPPWSFAFPSND